VEVLAQLEPGDHRHGAVPEFFGDAMLAAAVHETGLRERRVEAEPAQPRHRADRRIGRPRPLVVREQVQDARFVDRTHAGPRARGSRSSRQYFFQSV
jgi:hypothetical protein